MKNFTIYNFKKQLFVPLLLAICSLSACMKTEKVDQTVYAGLRVINASATLNTYNVYINNATINSAALPYGGAINYAQKDLATYTLKITPASSAEELYTTPISLANSAYYSFYLVGHPNNYSNLLLNDNLAVPTEGKAYIRLVHLSPDAGAIDLAKTGGNKLIENSLYKTGSTFVAVDPGTISLDILDHANGTVKTSQTDVVLSANLHYDIICGGYATPENDTFRNLNIKTILIK